MLNMLRDCCLLRYRRMCVADFTMVWLCLLILPLQLAMAGDAVEVSERPGAVVLRNRYVEAVVWPRTGMRIDSIRDRTANAMVARRIKFNFPFFEDGLKRDQMAGYRLVRHDDGSVTVAMNMRFAHHQHPQPVARDRQFAERILSCLVTVRPGSAAVHVIGRLDNPTPLRRSNRLWSDAILEETEDMQFLLPVANVTEHMALWLRDWPIWQTVDSVTDRRVRIDLSRRDQWAEHPGIAPTTVFAVQPIYGFAGAWYPQQGINRLRIVDPHVAPGAKIACYGLGQVELWAGTTPIVEHPGELLGPYQPVVLSQAYYLTSEIGPVSYADEDFAMHVRTGDEPLVELTGPTVMPAVRVVIVDDENKPITIAEGGVGPGEVIRLEPRGPLESFRVQIFTESQGMRANLRFPLPVPDQSHLWPGLKQACSRENPQYVELQEYANHTGMDTALDATARALRLFSDEEQDPDMLMSTALACYRIGDFEHALALCEMALITDPVSVEAYLVRGLIAWEQGMEEEASRHLVRAGTMAFYPRALLAMKSGNRQTAISLLKRMGGEAYRPMLLLAALLSRGEQADDALRLVRALVALNPASPEALETLARVAKRANQRELAQRAADARDALLQANPDAERQLGLFRDELDYGRWVYPARYGQPLPQPQR
jgi:hypothetical protein